MRTKPPPPPAHLSGPFPMPQVTTYRCLVQVYPHHLEEPTQTLALGSLKISVSPISTQGSPIKSETWKRRTWLFWLALKCLRTPIPSPIFQDQQGTTVKHIHQSGTKLTAPRAVLDYWQPTLQEMNIFFCCRAWKLQSMWFLVTLDNHICRIQGH